MGDSCLLALGYLFVVDGKRRRRQQLLTMGSPSKPSRKKMKSSWNAHCSNINTTHLSLAATKIYEARIFWYHSSHDSSQIFLGFCCTLISNSKILQSVNSPERQKELTGSNFNIPLRKKLSSKSIQKSLHHHSLVSTLSSSNISHWGRIIIFFGKLQIIWMLKNCGHHSQFFQHSHFDNALTFMKKKMNFAPVCIFAQRTLPCYGLIAF